MVETLARCFIVVASLFLAVYWASTGRQLDGSPVPPLGRVVGPLFMLIFVAIAAAPWLRDGPRRFSLRTLLIATALIAVVLGLAVYATR
jgi:uncharacterized membrane protein